MKSELFNRLQYNNKESPLFIPNEIFDDLFNSNIKGNHIPFAYSYYYLISWMYRYCKYGLLNIDNKMIKSILGYSPTYPEIDYIIKKNGILDSMEYTSTVKDYPISWTFEDQYLEFVMLSDMDEIDQKYIRETRSRKYTIKYPVKAFFRYEDSDYNDGTFYEVDKTHLIPFEVFLFCMNNKEIGCTGFYIWSYLKMKNQIYDNGYDVSLDDLSSEVNIPRSTLCQYVAELRKYRMVTVYHNQEYFCLALKEDDRSANTYKTNEWEWFSDKPVAYEKMKVISKKEYYEKFKIKSELNVDELSDLFA